MIKPDIYNDFVIYKGLDFIQALVLAGIDLTDCECKCQIRSSQDQDGDLLAEFTVTVDPEDAPIGKLTLFLEKADTKNLNGQIGYYCLVVTDVNDVDLPYLMGSIAFAGSATVLA